MVTENVNISHLHKLYHFLHTPQCMYNKKIRRCCYKQPMGRSCAHLQYIHRYLNESKQLGVKKKTPEAFKTPVAIKVKCTHSMVKTVQLKQTFLAIKLQTSEFSMVLLVVVTHEVWKKQRKNLLKWPQLPCTFNEISLVLHHVDRKSTR